MTFLITLFFKVPYCEKCAQFLSPQSTILVRDMKKLESIFHPCSKPYFFNKPPTSSKSWKRLPRKSDNIFDLRSYNQFVTSIHQTNNFVFPNFSQFELLKKITNFLLVQNRFFFLSFGPMKCLKSLFSFSTAQLRKFRGKNLATKQDSWFGGGWFDVMN